MDQQRTFTLFEELFRGSSQAHGLVHGECVRTPPTPDLWRAHLFGNQSLGIYPTVKLTQGTCDDSQLVCRWGCSDIDTHGPRAFTPPDARVHAKNVVTALAVLGHTGWVELTKSEGYHVWLFADGWVDAQVMRSALLLAHQLADVPAYEVNPKDALGATELGNYVNLPYPRVGKNRFIISLEDGEALAVSAWVEVAHRLRSSVAQLHETAGLYVPPAPPAPVTMRPFSGLTAGATTAGTYSGVDPGWETSRDIEDEELREAARKLNGKGWTIFRYGPNQGGRGLTLFRLAVECRESGLTPDETLRVIVDGDWRFGKYLSGVDGHTDGMRYLVKIVQDVFG